MVKKTNLKEKMVMKEMQNCEDHKIYGLEGVVECDPANEFLEYYEANLKCPDIDANKPFIAK